jgi:hypothetical protein
MILLATAQAAILVWWQSISIGGAPIQARMVDAKSGGDFIKPATRAIALIDVTSIRKIGQDETRFAPSGDNLIPTINGNRVITFTCRVDSFTQDDGNTAEHICEIARTRLLFPVRSAALKAAGLALVDTFPTVSLPFKPRPEDRLLSRAAMDVQFAIAAEETDSDNLQDTIGSVEIQSDIDDTLPLTGLTNIDGTPTSPQVNMTVSEP